MSASSVHHPPADFPLAALHYPPGLKSPDLSISPLPPLPSAALPVAGGRASGEQATAGVYSALTRLALGLSPWGSAQPLGLGPWAVEALFTHCQPDKNKTNTMLSPEERGGPSLNLTRARLLLLPFLRPLLPLLSLLLLMPPLGTAR